MIWLNYIIIYWCVIGRYVRVDVVCTKLAVMLVGHMTLLRFLNLQDFIDRFVFMPRPLQAQIGLSHTTETCNWHIQLMTSQYSGIWHQSAQLERAMNRKSTWWRHQMETFSALLVICAGNSPVTGEFPAQRPVTRNFDVFCDLRLNKRLSKQSWDWWFETLSDPYDVSVMSYNGHNGSPLLTWTTNLNLSMDKQSHAQ